MSYLEFEKKWLGKRVDYDSVFNYQCVDLVLQYLAEVHGIRSGVWGNAIDYWTKPTKTLLASFEKVASTAARQGDIVVLHGLSGNIFGHIGIATGKSDGGNIEILEQNGSSGNGDGKGGNAIRKRMIPRPRVAGLLRKKAAAKPVATPAPKPAATPATYNVVADIPAYYTANDAKHRKNPRGVVRKRSYAVFNMHDGMVNVTTQAGVPGAWINSGDNKAATNPVMYKIPRGTNLTNISKQFGSTVAQIVTWNKSKYPNMTANYIQAGWTIRVK